MHYNCRDRLPLTCTLNWLHSIILESKIKAMYIQKYCYKLQCDVPVITICSYTCTQTQLVDFSDYMDTTQYMDLLKLFVILKIFYFYYVHTGGIEYH